MSICSISACNANKADFESTQKQIYELQKQIDNLKTERERDNIRKLISEIAFLTPGGSGYSAVKFDLGVLTVQLVDVQPYANGSKVTLKFGNPLFADIDGLKATIEYGRVDGNGDVVNENYKSKEITVSEVIRQGAWSAAPIILDGLAPAELGFIRVKEVSHTGIKLFK